MISFKKYIIEKLHINEDTKSLNDSDKAEEIKQNIIDILNVKPKTLSSLKEKIVKFSNKLEYYGIGGVWSKIKSENLSDPFNIEYNNKSIFITEAYKIIFFSTPSFPLYRLTIMRSSDNDCYFELYEHSSIYKVNGKFSEIVGPYKLGTNFLDYLKSINNTENHFNDKRLSIIKLLKLEIKP